MDPGLERNSGCKNESPTSAYVWEDSWHELPRAKRVFDRSAVSVKHPRFLSKFCKVPDKCVAAGHMYKICRLCTLSRKFHPLLILQVSFIFKHAHKNTHTHIQTHNLSTLSKKSSLLSSVNSLAVIWIISELTHPPLPSRSMDQFECCHYHVTCSEPRQNPRTRELSLSHLSNKPWTKSPLERTNARMVPRARRKRREDRE